MHGITRYGGLVIPKMSKKSSIGIISPYHPGEDPTPGMARGRDMVPFNTCVVGIPPAQE